MFTEELFYKGSEVMIKKYCNVYIYIHRKEPIPLSIDAIICFLLK